MSYPLTRVSGGGIIRVAGTDPAAGAEVSQTVPASQTWLLLAATFPLVTSAVAANRTPQLIIDDGTNEVFRIDGAQTQAASLTRKWTFCPVGTTITSGAVTGGQVCPIPDNLYLPTGWRIKTVTLNLDAGDNYGVPVFYIMQFDNVGPA